MFLGNYAMGDMMDARYISLDDWDRDLQSFFDLTILIPRDLFNHNILRRLHYEDVSNYDRIIHPRIGRRRSQHRYSSTTRNQPPGSPRRA
jgi:hypothetical protein